MKENQQHYVLGFALNPEKTKVLLIRKKKPAWQENCLNGVGGKIEHYDASPVAAMEREFKEETGLASSGWQHYCTMEGDFFRVWVFLCEHTDLDNAQSTTIEPVEYVEINTLFTTHFKECISNLQWLIPMTLDRDIARISIQAQYSA